MAFRTSKTRRDPEHADGWQSLSLSRWRRRGVFFYYDGEATAVWLRDRGEVEVPVAVPGRRLDVIGRVLDLGREFPTAYPFPGLRVQVNGRRLGQVWPVRPGRFHWCFLLPPGGLREGAVVTLELGGVGWSNFFAWLGRRLEKVPLPRRVQARLQEYRQQKRNRQLLIEAIAVDDDELLNFRNHRLMPAPRFLAETWKPGLNLVGFFRAALGVGESVRCMARACDAVGLPAALVDLRLNCLNPPVDDTYASRFQAENPHPVNVFHLDAPQSEEIDHHHGPEFRRGRYNVGYWAWELPDFPDPWVRQHRYFDEIWCPSEFTRAAIAAKVPKPVLAMPHAIDFPVPAGSVRAKFGLPEGVFLFLFIYDFNSTQERKNPGAVIQAFRRAFPGGGPVGLVIKAQNPTRHPAALAALEAELAGLANTVLLNRTLSRAEVYELQQSCDCFVSLHRAEGFGLNVAEAMFLGKPVIATDWSGTAEFVNDTNGCPVKHRLVRLERDYGPYGRGQVWADPDLDHGAFWMQRLVADETLRQRLGAQAAADIRRLFSPQAVGRRYARRLQMFSLW